MLLVSIPLPIYRNWTIRAGFCQTYWDDRGLRLGLQSDPPVRMSLQLP